MDLETKVGPVINSKYNWHYDSRVVHAFMVASWLASHRLRQGKSARNARLQSSKNPAFLLLLAVI